MVRKHNQCILWRLTSSFFLSFLLLPSLVLSGLEMEGPLPSFSVSEFNMQLFIGKQLRVPAWILTAIYLLAPLIRSVQGGLFITADPGHFSLLFIILIYFWAIKSLNDELGLSATLSPAWQKMMHYPIWVVIWTFKTKKEQRKSLIFFSASFFISQTLCAFQLRVS